MQKECGIRELIENNYMMQKQRDIIDELIENKFQ